MGIDIGARVKSKNKSGMIQVDGKLVALIDAETYVKEFLKSAGDPEDTWGVNYPDWKLHPVAVVKFDEPQKTATLEEWITSGMASGYQREILEQSYESAPTSTTVVFPYQDLEKVS